MGAQWLVLFLTQIQYSLAFSVFVNTKRLVGQSVGLENLSVVHSCQCVRLTV